MQRIKINDDSSNDGIECYYYQDLKTLYIEPTNSRQDWIENFTGWLWPKMTEHGLVNRKWWDEVQGILPMFEGLEIKRIVAYSKGGGQAWYVAPNFPGVDVVSIAGFPPWLRGNLPGKLFKKRGDIVPLFSALRYSEETTRGKWQPFWKSHRWTTEEINEILTDL